MMDGRVARVGKMSSTFGALYDSVLDRYSELVTLFGIFYYLMLQGYLWGSIITFIALIGSLMVSYVRARAEGLGLECKVGFMQRPERVVLTASVPMFSRYLRVIVAFIRTRMPDTNCAYGSDCHIGEFDGICPLGALL